jgi:chemotaxis protein MotB
MSRSRRGHAVAHESEERWLLTYADMITLLMALFMVLFSISSVNISKYQTLQLALKAAFSGSVLPGGNAIQQAGNTPNASQTPATSQPQAFVPSSPSIGVNGGAAKKAAAAAQLEQSNFVELEHLINDYASAHGLANEVKASVDAQGVQIKILSDHVLFNSGQATLQPSAAPLLNDISNLLRAVVSKNPIVVEGFTDNVPQRSATIPSNWYLSTDRADAVLRSLLIGGVAARRLSAEGFADLDPVASNATDVGRAQNRRVVIGVTRIPAAGSVSVTQTTTTPNPSTSSAG